MPKLINHIPAPGRLLTSTMLVAVAAAGILAYLLLATGGSSSAEDAAIPGVTVADLTAGGIRATVPDSGEKAKISQGEALTAATSDNPSGTALGTVLVNLQDKAQFQTPRLVWAVSLDPETNPPHPLHGAPGIEVPEVTKARFIVVFVDADTGEFLYRFESAEVN